MLSFRAQISWWDYLLAFLAGLVSVFAFAPFAWWPIAFLTPAVFFWLNLKPLQRWQRLRLAWVFGIGLFAGGAHWIYFSIHYFGGANIFLSTAMVAAFVVLIALMLMLFGLIASFFPYQTNESKLLLVFPAAWCLTEWFRGWFLTGFPWLQLGHSQTDTFLANYAPIFGSLGISWLVAVGAGALVLITIGEHLQKIYAGALLALLFVGGYGLSFINWTQPVGEKLFVSLIQANIPQEEKWLPEFRNQHIQKHIDMMEPRITSSHIIIWPETAIFDTFQRSMDDVVKPLQESFKTAETDLLMGGFQYEQSTDHMYNAIMSVRDLDVYGKRHLVPFSEYTPFLEYLRWLENFIMLPYENVAPWKGKVNLQVAGQPMRMSVCYEDAYGEEMIDGLPEATMLVNVSNDGWFTGSIEPAQHAQIARFRAIETGRYLLRATNNGISAIINEKGKVVVTGPQYQEVVVEEFAQPMQGITPYIRWGNWFLIPMLTIALVVVGWLGRGKFR